MTVKYKKIISLGYFCSIAIDCEKLGYRNESMPFDWLISDFKENLNLIATHFADFLLYEHLYQFKRFPHYYLDVKNKIQFYHDFVGHKTLSSQLDLVKEKYSRRIDKFYKEITFPTLFIRYISNKEEMAYVLENKEKILSFFLSFFLSFNPQNEIRYIANNDLNTNSGWDKILFVTPDKNDTVKRDLSEEIRMIVGENFDNKKRNENLLFYNRKNKFQLFHRIKSGIQRKIMKKYRHDKQV